MSARTRHPTCTKFGVLGLAFVAVALAGCNGASGRLGGGRANKELPLPFVERPAGPTSWQAIQSSGTRVGQYATGLQAEFLTIQRSIRTQQAELQTIFNSNAKNVEIFYGTNAAIEARLHLGTLPNNRVLIEQWNEAQAALDQIAWNIRDLDRLVELLIGDANAINSVRRKVQTLGGDSEGNARDRDNLMRLEGDATAALNLINRLQQESLYVMGRESSFMQVRRPALATLQESIRAGNLADTVIATATVPQQREPSPQTNSVPTPAESVVSERSVITQEPALQQETVSRVPTEQEAEQQVSGIDVDAITSVPLVIIRFDRPNVVYEGPLERAIRRTLAKDPNMQFNLVAVFPPHDDEAALMQAESASWNFAQSVFRSLTEKIGVAPEQIEMRTQIKDAAKSNEVHIYVSAKAL